MLYARTREKKVLSLKGQVIDLGMNLTQLIPIIGNVMSVVGLAKSVFQTGLSIHACIKDSPDKPGGVMQNLNKQKAEIEEQCLAMMQFYLGDVKPLPCILVLDDAQWADAATLHFVHTLFNKAVADTGHALGKGMEGVLDS